MDHGGSTVARNGQARVSDLELAAYLICQGAQLLDIARTPDPNRRDFVLALPDETLERSVRLFMSGRAVVEPSRFAQARRALQRALRGLADEHSSHGHEHSPSAAMTDR